MGFAGGRLKPPSDYKQQGQRRQTVSQSPVQRVKRPGGQLSSIMIRAALMDMNDEQLATLAQRPPSLDGITVVDLALRRCYVPDR